MKIKLEKIQLNVLLEFLNEEYILGQELLEKTNIFRRE